MMVQYAPILVFTYKRLDTLKSLLNSLGKNPEASESNLFIFSDINEKEEDTNKVRNVRNFIKEYKKNNSLFKSIKIVEAESHMGLAKSIIDRVSEVISEFGRVIVLEDDLIVSEVFLDYMNSCLSYYEYDERIWSVSGYSSYVKAKENYDKPVYLDYRASSWGWATWKDRWDRVNWDVPDYDSFKWDIAANRRFCRGGNDLPSMLRACIKGRIDSWAVRWCYYQSKYGKYALAPTRSLVVNEGFSLDATNCTEDDYNLFGTEILDQKKRDWCIEGLVVDKAITNELRHIHNISFVIRIRDKFREIKKYCEKCFLHTV